MSTSSAHVGTSAPGYAPGARLPARARAYFASDSKRVLQTVLGLIWLLDGGLQFQSFMYWHGFIEMLTGLTTGQPGVAREQRQLGRATLGQRRDPLQHAVRADPGRDRSRAVVAARGQARARRCRSPGR